MAVLPEKSDEWFFITQLSAWKIPVESRNTGQIFWNENALYICIKMHFLQVIKFYDHLYDKIVYMCKIDKTKLNHTQKKYGQEMFFF